MSQSIVKKLSTVFLNFENSFKNTNYSKEELNKRSSKITEDYYSGKVMFKAGVKSDFIRIYQNDKNMSIGFSFITNGEPDIVYPITISIFQDNKRYFKEVTPTVLSDGLKSIYKTTKPEIFEEVILAVFKTFEFSASEETNVILFDEFYAFDEIKILTEKEREDIDSSKESYTEISKQRYKIQSEINRKVAEYQSELENYYQLNGVTFNTLKQQEAAALQEILESEVKFVDKVVSYYNNFDISLEKFLNNISRKFQFGYFSSKGYDKALDNRIKGKL
jgi:hypothetical protein